MIDAIERRLRALANRWVDGTAGQHRPDIRRASADVFDLAREIESERFAEKPKLACPGCGAHGGFSWVGGDVIRCEATSCRWSGKATDASSGPARCTRCGGSGMESPSGAELRAMREKAGISQAEAARLLGKAGSYLSEIEREKKRATVEVVAHYRSLATPIEEI